MSITSEDWHTPEFQTTVLRKSEGAEGSGGSDEDGLRVGSRERGEEGSGDEGEGISGEEGGVTS